MSRQAERALPVTVGTGIVGATALLLALGAMPAQAHSDLVDTRPANGAEVDEAPDELELQFTGSVSATFARVSLRRGGSPPQPMKVRTAGTVLTAAVPAPPDGAGRTPVTWEASYRLVSADGHPVVGSLLFTAPPGTQPAITAPAPPTRAAESAGSQSGGTAIVAVTVALAFLTAIAVVLAVGRRSRMAQP